MYILIKRTGLDQSDPIIRLIPLSGIPLSGVYCSEKNNFKYIFNFIHQNLAWKFLELKVY
jgi:hypothetical protein